MASRRDPGPRARKATASDYSGPIPVKPDRAPLPSNTARRAAAAARELAAQLAADADAIAAGQYEPVACARIENTWAAYNEVEFGAWRWIRLVEVLKRGARRETLRTRGEDGTFVDRPIEDVPDGEKHLTGIVMFEVQFTYAIVENVSGVPHERWLDAIRAWRSNRGQWKPTHALAVALQLSPPSADSMKHTFSRIGPRDT